MEQKNNNRNFNRSRTPQDGRPINLDLANQERAKKAAIFGKKVKGFYIQLTQNQTTETQVQISGTAWNMLGFAFVQQDQLAGIDISFNTFSFLVDNEIIIQDANLLAFTKGTPNACNFYTYEYYPYERPLTQTANLRFVIFSAVTTNMTLNIYYQ